MTGKISRSELVIMATLTMVGTVFIELPRYVSAFAAQCGWISVALATVPAILISLILVWLSNRFPGQTLVGYAQALIGRPLGKLVAIIMALIFLEGSALLVRDFSLTILILTQPHANDAVVIGVFILLLLYMVFWGAEVIARVAVSFLPYIVATPILMTFGTLGFVHPGRFLPLLGVGLTRVLHGTYVSSTYFGEIILISMLLPRVRAKRNPLWLGALAVLAAAPPLIVSVASAIGVFGPAETTRLLFPGIELARMVTLGESLQRIEALFVIIWMLAAMVKISIFSWAGAEALAESLNLKDYRVTLPAMFTLVFILSLMPETVWAQVALRRFLLQILPAFFYGIPLLLAGVALIRRKKGAVADAQP